jgi:ADP-ribose pyrophosphatase YjhB (NUDIX family)
MPRKFNELICKNCGSYGHNYRDCPYPIISFGILCYYIDENKIIKYLMIQRKNTLAFMEFLKGRYNVLDENYMSKLINHMTQDERLMLKNNNFEKIWSDIWLEASNKNIKEYFESKQNFTDLSKNNKLQNIINNSNKVEIESEWGFPKGRRKIKETDLDCSIREFCEETQFEEKDIKFEYNKKIFSEIFFGTNNILYKHIYYLAKIIKKDKNLHINPNFLHQVREIRDIKWCTYNEVLKNIGNKNIERVNIFKQIDNIIKNM